MITSIAITPDVSGAVHDASTQSLTALSEAAAIGLHCVIGTYLATYQPTKAEIGRVLAVQVNDCKRQRPFGVGPLRVPHGGVSRR